MSMIPSGYTLQDTWKVGTGPYAATVKSYAPSGTTSSASSGGIGGDAQSILDDYMEAVNRANKEMLQSQPLLVPRLSEVM